MPHSVLLNAPMRRLCLLVVALFALAACAGLPTGPDANSRSVDTSKPVRVALLVPQGASNPQIGVVLANSLVNAARMAQRDLSGVKVDLKVYPTAGTVGGATAAAQRALADGADVFLGPLFAENAAAVGNVAFGQGRKVFAFSNNSDVASGNVFILGTTLDSQARRIVSYTSAAGLRNMGLVYPNTVAGEIAARAVRNAVAGSSARLVADESYELSEAGIVNSATSISSKLRGTGANVVVFTDNLAGGLTLMTGVLRDNGLDRGSYKYIGTSLWDSSPQALGERGLQGGWYVRPDPARQRQFEARYRAAYGGSQPHEIAGLAYDGMAAIGALVRRGGKNAFTAGNITTQSGFAGVYGTFRFRPDNTNDRALAVMQISNGVPSIVDPAPRSFGSVGN